MWETIGIGWAFAVLTATSIWGLGFLALFILWLVHEDSEGWSIFWILVLGFLAYQSITISLTTALIYAACYIPAGIAWSMYRWKRYCTTEVEDFKENAKTEKSPALYSEPEIQRMKEMDRSELNSRLAPNNNISRFAHWIVAWPFSAIENILGDLYDMIVKMIKTYLINVYTRISDNAMKDI